MATRRPDIGPFTEDFALRLKFRRLTFGLTLRELAERLVMLEYPLSKDALSQIETGHRRVTLDDAAILCVALDMDLDLRSSTLVDDAQAGWPLPQRELRLLVDARSEERRITPAKAAEELRSEHQASFLGNVELAMASAARLFDVKHEGFRREDLSQIHAAETAHLDADAHKFLSQAVENRRLVRAYDKLIEDLNTDG